jgi:hypothetical protein
MTAWAARRLRYRPHEADWQLASSILRLDAHEKVKVTSEVL